jgi:hypothetical protein
MENRAVVPARSVVAHADAPPVGSAEVTTLAFSSTATHRFTDGQEIAAVPLCSVLLAAVVVHADAPPVGSVEVKMVPSVSTAAQKLVDGQETVVRPLAP